MTPLILGIEGGGTKFNLVLGTGPEDLRAETRIATTTPEETLARIIAWTRIAEETHGRIAAVGIGCFGPVDVGPSSATWGHITQTNKPGWSHMALVPQLRAVWAVPFGFDTDVNAAALGEAWWGAGRSCDPVLYLTVGTGVGGGVIIGGQPLHGLLHPEMGHVPVPQPASPGAVDLRGQCAAHESCLEGYVCGPAIARRWGRPAPEIPPEDAAWDDLASTLAHGLTSFIYTLSPQRLVLGGGVMKVRGLLDKVRSHVVRHLNGYLPVPALLDGIHDYLVPPALGDRSGVLGAIALGQRALQQP